MATLSAPAPARKPRSKPARTVQVLQRPGDQAEGRILIAEGKASDVYFLAELPTQIGGRAFRVVKFGSDVGTGYDVLIGARPADSTCDCKGHTYHGHCRHVEALATLTNLGRI